MQNRAENVDRAQLQDRAANVDRSQAQSRAAAVDRAQVQERAAGFDRLQQQNRQASAATINRDNALRGAGDAAQTRQQIDRGAASQVAMDQQISRGAAPTACGGPTTRVGRRGRREATAVIMGQPLQQASQRRWLPRRGAAMLLVAILAATLPAIAQQVFPTPDEAVDALVDGLARHDDTRVRAVLGPDYRRLLPLDTLSEQDRTDFLAAWSQGHRIERSGETAKLVLSDGWTLPIPVARRGEGWAFDTRAGQNEVRTRRIGRNELAAMKSVYAYYDAQREYAEQFRSGDACPANTPGGS